ncbi:MAG: trigger factor [Patescibacteria group bacterium]|jgi:trigger factor
MKSEKKVDKSQVELKIALEEGEWQEAIKQAATKLSQGLKIAGFRPGKAPLEVIMNEVGETRVVSEAAEFAINKFYLTALKEQQVLPIVPPKISVEKVELKTPLVFTATVVTLPEVELGDYKTIKIAPNPVAVDADRIDGVLKNIQRQQATFNLVEREAKLGDWAEIDFEGKLEGKPFAGGSSKNHPLIIGDGVFLPDFETALIGMKAGEEKTFSITFPLDYKADLANKTVEFTVKLHRVKAVVLPELNDELAKAVGKFDNLEALKKDISKFLEEDATKQELDRQKEEAINQLIKLAKVDLPEVLVEQEIDGMVHDLEHQLEHQKTTLAEYLKKTEMTEQKLREDWQATARRRVLAGLALNAFQKAENIIATDQDIDKEIARLQEIYPADKEKIVEKYQQEWERGRLKTLLSGQMAIDKLWQMATK